VAPAKPRRLRPAKCRRGRPRRPRFYSGFSTFQCFAGKKISLPCNNENFPQNSRAAPPFVSRSARSAARPYTRSCGFEASETIPFPGPDSIFSSRCGAISGQLRPPLAMQPVSERGAVLPSGGGLRHARSRNGDRVRPSARSSWGWDEAAPRPWFGRREGRAERAVLERKGMGRLGAENDDRLRYQ
jgi:hypothetical protein